MTTISGMATNSIAGKKNIEQILVSISHVAYFLGFGTYSNNPWGSRVSED